MLLRNEKETVLAEVSKLVQENADLCHEAAQRIATEPAHGVFAQLEDRYGELGKALSKRIRQLGDLPSTPDPDREAVMEAAAYVKSLFSHDAAASLAQGCLDAGNRLLAEIEHGMAAELDPASRTVLDDARRQALECHARLTTVLAQRPA
jgi:hypothetical protein